MIGEFEKGRRGRQKKGEAHRRKGRWGWLKHTAQMRCCRGMDNAFRNIWGRPLAAVVATSTLREMLT